MPRKTYLVIQPNCVVVGCFVFLPKGNDSTSALSPAAPGVPRANFCVFNV